jgi:hypothetical protein
MRCDLSHCCGRCTRSPPPGAGLQAVDAPARTAAIPALVRRELLPAAAALHQILMQVGLVAAYAIEVATFAAASRLAAALRPLALALLAVAGAADVVSAVFRNTILQLTVPDGLRGRLAAIHIGVVTGGPRLGDAEAGAVAAIAGPRVSVVSGGLACLAGVALLAWRLPELGRAAIEPSDPDAQQLDL